MYKKSRAVINDEKALLKICKVLSLVFEVIIFPKLTFWPIDILTISSINDKMPISYSVYTKLSRAELAMLSIHIFPNKRYLYCNLFGII